MIKSLNKSNEKFHQHIKTHNHLIEEFHRVMKPKSVFNLDDHRLTEDNIISTVTGQNLFKISKKLKRTLVFVRIYSEINEIDYISKIVISTEKSNYFLKIYKFIKKQIILYIENIKEK